MPRRPEIAKTFGADAELEAARLRFTDWVMNDPNYPGIPGDVRTRDLAAEEGLPSALGLTE